MKDLLEIIKSVLFLILLFGTLYVSLWVFCPCGEQIEVSHNEHAEITNN